MSVKRMYCSFNALCVLAGKTAVFIGSDHSASTERLSADGKDAQTDLGSARLRPRDETAQ